MLGLPGVARIGFGSSICSVTTDDRNLTLRTQNEMVAKDLYQNLPEYAYLLATSRIAAAGRNRL